MKRTGRTWPDFIEDTLEDLDKSPWLFKLIIGFILIVDFLCIITLPFFFTVKFIKSINA